MVNSEFFAFLTLQVLGFALAVGLLRFSVANSSLHRAHLNTLVCLAGWLYDDRKIGTVLELLRHLGWLLIGAHGLAYGSDSLWSHIAGVELDGKAKPMPRAWSKGWVFSSLSVLVVLLSLASLLTVLHISRSRAPKPTAIPSEQELMKPHDR